MSEALLAGGLAGSSAVLAGLALRTTRRRAVRERAGGASLDAGERPGASRPVPRAVLEAAVALVAGAGVAGFRGAVAGAVVALVARAWRARRAARARVEALGAQLGDAVSSVAAGLRAGLSLSQSVRFAADEGEPPLAHELRGVVDHSAMGLPLDESLRRWADAHEDADVRLVAGVLRLHRRTGGDLPRVLDRLAKTLAERREAAAEVRSLTAQARLSGAILGFLPIGFFLFLALTSREDMAAAYRSSLGATAIVLGLVLQGLAFVWIRRLLRVE